MTDTQATTTTPPDAPLEFWEWANRFTHSVGCFWVLPDGTIARCNPAFAQIIGRDIDDVIGSSVVSVTHPDDRIATRQRYKRLMDGDANGDRVDTQKAFVTPTGRRVFAMTHEMAFREEGVVVGVLALIYELADGANTTKLHELEAEIQALKELSHLFRNTSHTGVNLHVGDTNSSRNTADRGSSIETSHNDSALLKTMLIVACVVLGLVVLGFVALVAGGHVSFGGGGTVDILPK